MVVHRWLRFPIPLSPVLGSLLVTALLVVIAMLAFTPQFNTRDDIGMMLLASGKVIALEPSEYLLFTNIVLGHLLKSLYYAMPSVLWYAWYLLVSLCVGLWGLAYTLLRRTNTVATFVLLLVTWLVFGVYMVVQLQFTMIAETVALSGLVLMLLSGSPPQRVASNVALNVASNIASNATSIFGALPLSVLCGAVLFVWSSLMRVEAALLVVLCCVPMLFVGMVGTALRERVVATLPAFVLVGVLGGAAYWYDAARYTAWGSENAREFNRLCGEFLDVKRIKRTPMLQSDYHKVLERVGWSVNDVEMLMNWFYMNDSLYNTSTLAMFIQELRRRETIVYEKPRVQEQILAKREELRAQVWARCWNTLRSPSALYAYAAGLLWLVVLAAWRTTRQALLQAVMLLVYAATLVAVIWWISDQTFLRDTPERVTHPLWLLTALVPLAVAVAGDSTSLEQSPQRKHPLRGLVLGGQICALLASVGALIVLVLGVVAVVREARAASVAAAEQRQRLETVVNALQPKHEILYVVWADAFPFDGIQPFAPLPSGLDSLHALWLAWCQRLPTSRAVLSKFGVSDVYRGIVEQEHVYLLLSLNQIQNDDLRYLRRFSQYMRQHYGRGMRFRDSSYTVLNAGETNPYATFLQVRLQWLARDSSAVP